MPWISSKIPCQTKSRGKFDHLRLPYRNFEFVKPVSVPGMHDYKHKGFSGEKSDQSQYRTYKIRKTHKCIPFPSKPGEWEYTKSCGGITCRRGYKQTCCFRPSEHPQFLKSGSHSACLPSWSRHFREGSPRQPPLRHGCF